jgi:hypothetical protein
MRTKIQEQFINPLSSPQDFSATVAGASERSPKPNAGTTEKRFTSAVELDPALLQAEPTAIRGLELGIWDFLVFGFWCLGFSWSSPQAKTTQTRQNQ